MTSSSWVTSGTGASTMRTWLTPNQARAFIVEPSRRLLYSDSTPELGSRNNQYAQEFHRVSEANYQRMPRRPKRRVQKIA